MLKCATCGKEVVNVVALKIHIGRMHKRGKSPKARQVAEPVAAPAVLDV